MTFKKNLLDFSITTSFTIIVLLTLNCTSIAGELDSPSAPTNVSSGMYTTSDIYNRLNSGASSSISTFNEPTQAPANQGHNLNQVMAIAPQVDNQSGATPADVTFGKKFWGLKDGAWGLQTGTKIIFSSCIPPAYVLNSPADPNNVDGNGARWCIPGDGTVIDLFTGLVWLRDLSALGSLPWTGCESTPCNNFPSPSGKTAVGILGELADGFPLQINGNPTTLSDGSVSGDWRAPSIIEASFLNSLANTENLSGIVPQPFYRFQLVYWTSSYTPNIPGSSIPGTSNHFETLGFRLVQTSGSYSDSTLALGVAAVRKRKDTL